MKIYKNHKKNLQIINSVLIPKQRNFFENQATPKYVKQIPITGKESSFQSKHQKKIYILNNNFHFNYSLSVLCYETMKILYRHLLYFKQIHKFSVKSQD